MVAIVGAMLFAALNQTIVGTVLPRIVQSLGGVEYLTWVFTLYMLTSSVSSVLAGRLSDLYGRKPFLVTGVVVFSVGSFLCGLSGSIWELIVWRGLQGIGGGLVMSTSFAAVADLFSPRERGRWQGLLGAGFGLASVLGPTLGGFVVDHADWHWVFWIFLPVGVPTLWLLLRLFPSVPRGERQPLDVAGAGFLTATLVPLLLAFSWAGTRYPWTSVEVDALLGAAVVAAVLLVVAERRAPKPVLPLGMLSNPTVALSNGVSFLLGAGMFGAIIYVPMFAQVVLGSSATESGFVTMPMTLGLVLASAVSGQVVTRTGRYKLLAIAGLLVVAAGTTSLALLDSSSSMARVALGIAVTGLGIGVGLPVFTLTVQNAVDPREVGVATASSQLSRQLGGVLGASVMGSVFNQRMGDVARGFAGPVAEGKRLGVASGIQGVFWMATVAVVVAVALAVLLREEPLKGGVAREPAEA